MGKWKMSNSSVKYVYTFPSLKLDEVVNIKSEDEVREELDVEEDPLALPETTLANRPAFMQAHGEIKEVNIQFACNECDRNFTRKHGLLLHILQVHKLKTTTFSCEKCDFRTTKKNTLRYHTNQVHGGILFACYTCKYRTAVKGNLELHVQAHHGGMKYTCNQCGNLFTSPGSVKIHVESQHLGIKKHACTDCGKTFTRRHSLKYHIVRYHKDNIKVEN